jgi:hypothetical protein
VGNTDLYLTGPKWLYNDSLANENPLRYIHSDRNKRTKFYENMSKAFARMARKRATVMHMTDDYDDPPQNGIWGRIELPALRHETDVTIVRTIRNVDGVTSC